MRRWLFRLFSAVLILFVIACAGIWLIEFYPRHGSHPPLKLPSGTLAIKHAKIYVSPTAPPIDDGTVLIHDGLIAAVGTQIAVPADATIIPCDHCVVTAGFWNTHVHFTEPKWAMAQWKSRRHAQSATRRHVPQPRLHYRHRSRLQPRRHLLHPPPYRERRTDRSLHLHRRNRALSAPWRPVLSARIHASVDGHDAAPARDAAGRNADRPPQPRLGRGRHQALHRLMDRARTRAAHALEHRSCRRYREPPERQARLRPPLQPRRYRGRHQQRRRRAGPRRRRHAGCGCQTPQHSDRQKHGHDSHAQDVHHHRHHRSALHGPDAAPRCGSFTTSAARSSSEPTSAT